ncbi:hypothetical protein DPMN_124945 [Dreissena polymorpha]|uniref:NACHT domain-containing protein n=1 Tax=Dreissena polymorpha TaxID=45954 RepID=A0A9D4JT15_DREPO|nr:hypothetical protein DPMN_124945 [Dreissena polymorpha]
MGKTTVAAKLVLDWCNAQNGPPSFHGENSAFADIATLKQFKCVFFIKLGDHSGTSDVTEIIQKQIIDSIYTSTGRNDAYKLLNAILERDKCLLIQDGLDEWTSDDSRLVQPFMVASHSRCAVLTTSRSWKLTDERIKESQIDSLLVLKGVNDSNRMSKKMLHLLMPKDDIDSKHNEFLRDLDTFANNIDQMLVSPLLLSLIVCSWVEGNRLTNSRCKIYSILIDGLFKKVSLKRVYFVNQTFTCLKNTHYIQQHIKYLKVLSKIAFLMFGVKEEITDRELLKHLTSKQKLFALNVGILTERKCVTPTYTPSMFKFIHKSVREFLCAYYIACNPSAISSISNKIADGIDAVNILADVFIFLCGLKISSANRISQLLDNIINSHNMINITQSQFDNIQSKITQGFAEAKSNIQNEENIQFTVSRIEFREVENDNALTHILNMNSSTVRSIKIAWATNELTEQQIGLCGRDFGSFPNLEILHIIIPEGIAISSHGFMKLQDLTLNCKCDGLDLSTSHCLKTINLGEHITLLPNGLRGLNTIKSLILWCKCDGLDLSHCHNLETVFIAGDIYLLHNGLLGLENLKNLTLHCKCHDLDLSSCYNLETINIGKDTTVSSYGINGLTNLISISLSSTCDAVNLSSCKKVKSISICEGFVVPPEDIREIKEHNYDTLRGGLELPRSHMLDTTAIVLLPDGLSNLKDLTTLILICKCDELELSSCHNLEKVYIEGEITLLSTGLHGLEKLVDLTLRCKCDGLDLSLSHSLKTINIGRDIVLLPNGLRGLDKLHHLVLLCRCDGLDISDCKNLETLRIHGDIILASTGLCGLGKLQDLTLYCKCDDLDLSDCNSLEQVNIGGDILLLPYGLRGLNKLKSIILWCKCDGLDLSHCSNLETVHIGEDLTLLPNGLRGLQKLENLTVECKCDYLDLSSCDNLQTIDIASILMIRL